jgi:O-antigen/teichoic acid export membrane protein
MSVQTLDRRDAVLFRSIGAVGLTRGIAVVLDGAAYIAVARHLGPELYGYYLGYMALAALLDFAADMAVVDITVREIATEPRAANTWLFASTVLRLAIASLFILAFAAYVYAGRSTSPPDVLNSAWIVALVLPAGALRMPLAVFRACQQLQYELVATIAARATNLLLVLLAIQAGAGIAPFFVAAVFSRFLLAGLAWAIGLRRSGLSLSPAHFSGAAVRKLIRESIPMAVSGLFVSLQLRGDILMVARIIDAHAAGIYGVVASLPEYFLLVPVIITTPVLPLLSQAFAAAATDAFSRLYRALVSVLTAAIVPVAIIGALMPERIVSLLFGPDYVEAAGLLPWLLASIVCMWISHATAIATVAIGWQRAFIWIQSICLLAFVGLNLLLIPLWGLVGAALARLVATLIAPVLTHWVVKRQTGAGFDGRALGQVAISALALGLAVMALQPAGQVFAAAVGIVLYVGGLWATGFVQHALPELKER